MSGKMHYIHQRNNIPGVLRYTMAIEIPEKDELVDFVIDHMESGEKEFPVYLGIARVHPTDQFNKRMGRYVAINKSNFTPLKFVAITTLEDKTYYTFSLLSKADDKDPYMRSITVIYSTIPSSKHVKLEHAVVE